MSTGWGQEASSTRSSGSLTPSLVSLPSPWGRRVLQLEDPKRLHLSGPSRLRLARRPVRRRRRGPLRPLGKDVFRSASFHRDPTRKGGLTGSLAFSPNGTVVPASNRGLQRLWPDGAVVTVRARWPPHSVPFSPLFGVGVAVGPAGQDHVDTVAGEAVPGRGLLEVLPGGRVV